jgi:Fe-S oxidoreductase
MKIEDPILVTDNCRYSLMCRQVCPVHHITKLETLSPHGWALTVASVRRGLLEWNAETVDVLYKCADCGDCRANCATDQPLPTAIAAAREWVVSLDLAPPAVYELDVALRQWGNPYEPREPGAVRGQGEVALFVGDAASYLWPQALEAALALLNAVGIDPVLVGVGRNNGYLASSIGMSGTAEALALANMDDLRASGARRLLVLTPGDFYTFGRLYDQRLGINLPPDVELVGVLPFLAEQLEARQLRLKQSETSVSYTYADPTHAVRVKSWHDAPRRLLSAVLSGGPLELFWRGGRAHPAGDLALAWTQPEIADGLTRARLADVAQTGAGVVITEDPATLYHLNRHAAELNVSVQGLYELLADHLPQ